MKLRQGRAFVEAPPHSVIDFLRNRNLETCRLPADHLCVAVRGEDLTLQVMNGRVREYPMREAFFLKLLKWGSLPAARVRRLSGETIAGILNDILLSIRSGDVTVRLEDGEALTITSRDYSELSDLEVIQAALPAGVSRVTRTDFFVRVYGETSVETSIFPGDICGLGFNILNSETGFRALSVWHYVLRYICSNGALVRTEGTVDGEIHYRRPGGHLQRILQDQIRPVAQAHDQVIAALRRSAASPAPDESSPAYIRLQTAIGRKVLASLREPHPAPPSLYDLFNIVTAHARGLQPSQRLQLESLAGDLLMGRG